MESQELLAKRKGLNPLHEWRGNSSVSLAGMHVSTAHPNQFHLLLLNKRQYAVLPGIVPAFEFAYKPGLMKCGNTMA